MNGPRSLGILLALAIPTPATVTAHPDTPRLLAEVEARLRHEPGNADLRMQRGVLYLDEEYANYPQAISDFTAALRVPRHREALIFRAVAYERTERHDLALRDLDRYIAAGGRDVRAFEQRADVRARRGDRAHALRDLAAASRLAPRPEQYLRRGELLVEEGRPSAAVAALQEGLTHLGPVPAIALRLVEVGTTARQYDAALSAIALLGTQGGRQEPWALRRAHVLAASGRSQEARAAFAGVLAALEQRERGGGYVNQTHWLEKAEALHGVGRSEEARRVFQSLGAAARRLPEYARVEASLGPSTP